MRKVLGKKSRSKVGRKNQYKMNCYDRRYWQQDQEYLRHGQEAPKKWASKWWEFEAFTSCCPRLLEDWSWAMFVLTESFLPREIHSLHQSWPTTRAKWVWAHMELLSTASAKPKIGQGRCYRAPKHLLLMKKAKLWEVAQIEKHPN